MKARQAQAEAVEQLVLVLGADMVKAYLRYELTETFGVVASNSNLAYDTTGKQVFTACLESLAVWNVKQGSQVAPTLCHEPSFHHVFP